MKKSLRAILAVVLVLALAGGTAATTILMGKQPAAQVNDRIQNAAALQQQERPKLEKDQIDATFNPNVKLITADDAAAVNNAITAVNYYTDGVRIQVGKGTKFAELGVGDVFYLEGSPMTPLTQTYIGKVESVTPNDAGAAYFVTMPAIDEVFDDLHFDVAQVLDKDTINVVQAAEGVTLAEGVGPEVVNTAAPQEGLVAHTLTHIDAGQAPEVMPLDEDQGFGGKEELLKFEVDLLKILKLKPKEEPKNEKVPPQEYKNVTVYTPKLGQCYHLKDCPGMANAKEKNPVKLSVILEEGKYRPCQTCNPPVAKDYQVEPKLTLSGGVGFEKIDLHAVCDWNVWGGMENLSVTASGTFQAHTTLTSSLELELNSGRTELGGDSAKLQGLNKKAFPIAFVGINVTLTPVEATGNTALDAVTSGVPATVGAMIYVDLSGKVTVTGTVSLEYTRPISASYVLYEDGKFVNKLNYEKGNNDLTFTMGTEATWEADAHFGASAMLYLFNVNIVDLSLVKLGAEVEGGACLKFTAHLLHNDQDAQTEVPTGNPTEYEASFHNYVRIYLKLLELNINISASVELLGATELSHSFEWSKALVDLTIWQAGTHKPARYVEGAMSYNHVTAKNGDILFYKDLNGTLVRQEGVLVRPIYSTGFFAICGIDESYIYLLVPEAIGSYSVVRVDHYGNNSRVILTGVANALMQDDTYMYYTTVITPSTARRIDRSSLEKSEFYSAEHPVQSLHIQEDGYYLTAEKSDFMSILFGGTYYRFLLSKDGALLKAYPTSPAPSDCQLRDQGSYYAAVSTASAGYPRSSATAVYWLAGDKSSSVLTQGVSGWNYAACGIFTVQNNPEYGEGAHPYVLTLYSAADGANRKLVGLYSDQALFTICQTEDGTWYYLDETQDKVILYSMDSNFRNLQEVTSYDRAQAPFSLSSCAMVLQDNTLYFYTMPDDNTCTIIDRYDLT